MQGVFCGNAKSKNCGSFSINYPSVRTTDGGVDWAGRLDDRRHEDDYKCSRARPALARVSVTDLELAETIQQDTACRRCGYNLRGLYENGRCPECNAPNILSILSEEEHAVFDPRWLDAVARGCKLASITCYVGLCFWLVFVAAQIIVTGGLLAIVGMVLLGAMVLALMTGLWLMTSPYAALGSTETAWSTRRLARACILLFLPTVIAVWLGGASFGSWIAIGVLFLGCPAGVGGLVGAWVLSRYVESLAMMIREDFTKHRARQYRRWFLASWAVLWFGALCGFIERSVAFAVAIGIGAMGVLGFGMLILALPTYLVSVLRGYALLARENWAHAERNSLGHDV